METPHPSRLSRGVPHPEGIGLETMCEGLWLLNLRVCAWLPVFGVHMRA